MDQELAKIKAIAISTSIQVAAMSKMIIDIQAKLSGQSIDDVTNNYKAMLTDLTNRHPSTNP